MLRDDRLKQLLNYYGSCSDSSEHSADVAAMARELLAIRERMADAAGFLRVYNAARGTTSALCAAQAASRWVATGEWYCLGMKVVEDPSLPPGTLKLVWQDGKVDSLLWTEVPTQEGAESLLEEAGVDMERLMADMRAHVEKTKARLAANPPARLYSEDEVRKAFSGALDNRDADYTSDAAIIDEAMRRLQGEGVERPSREERLQGLGFGAPKRDCDLHDLGLPGICTCRGVPL